jgi:hypothetical protein
MDKLYGLFLARVQARMLDPFDGGKPKSEVVAGRLLTEDLDSV